MNETNKKAEGKIIRVHREKGYGFIISQDYKFTKFFFHWTGLIQSTKNFTEIKEGNKVKFIAILGDSDKERNRGPRAIQIEIVD